MTRRYRRISATATTVEHATLGQKVSYLLTTMENTNNLAREHYRSSTHSVIASGK